MFSIYHIAYIKIFLLVRLIALLHNGFASYKNCNLDPVLPDADTLSFLVFLLFRPSGETLGAVIGYRTARMGYLRSAIFYLFTQQFRQKRLSRISITVF